MSGTQNASAASGLFIQGSRESGEDVRSGNVTAAVAVANIVKSSLGPVGLDKMLVDDIGDVTITNDGATILAQLEVEHPAARLLVDLAQLQDKEVGDGTTSVVLLAAELLKRGLELVQKQGLHPTTILAGYRTALKAAIAFLKSNILIPTSDLDTQHLMQAAKTSMSSKIIGKEGDFFAQMAVDAVQSVANTTSTAATSKKNKTVYPLSAIHILKVHGKSSLESYLMKGGFCLNATRASQGMPSFLGDPDDPTSEIKIAMIDMNLQRHRMAMGVSIQVKDPQEIERIKQREMDLTKEKIQKILNAGAKVVLTTKGIDDLCMKYFVEAGVLCARRVPKEDLKRLAKATGGQVVITLADMEGEESFDSEALGTCRAVQETRVGDGELLQVFGCQGSGASTIVLRGANEYMLDEIDRSLHDSLCVVKRMLESNSLVPGGGAVETALNVYLYDYALKTLDNREQLAVEAFADSLLVIPKTLAVNAAKDSAELVSKLKSIHAKSQTSSKEEDKNLKNYGLDLVEGEIRDNLAAGVVEPAISKIKSLRFATEAAITILRIDDRVTLTPGQGH
ncbi:thermosome subunit [Nitzschia inconspicua]|uniref:T-complex protein 1 subunit alpha n=1 Tax=Nitzschia inconspicua TaxID=303405 RepID=A0A9K3L276_9STRA|nr:thermosome subunit [Nitzschia inconspicua]